jgi:hypothetical protein
MEGKSNSSEFGVVVVVVVVVGVAVVVILGAGFDGRVEDDNEGV